MGKKHQWKIYNTNIMFKMGFDIIFKMGFDIIFVISCYIILLIFVFNLYFSKYSSQVKVPFYILFILLLTYLTYVSIRHWFNKNSTQRYVNMQTNAQLFELFQRFFIIYGEYILIIIGVFILFLVVYNLFIGLLIYTLTKSLWIAVGLLVLVLALIKNFVYTKSTDESFTSLIKEIIFYIPCLITDSIEFITKDYSNTSSTTFIVFIIIIIYLLIFFLVPLINLDGGYLLIYKPQELNKSTSFSTYDLLSYDASQFKDESTDYLDSSYNKIPDAITDVSEYPRDAITKNWKSTQVKEGFSGLVQQDTTYNIGKKTYSDSGEIEFVSQPDIGELYNGAYNNVTNQFTKIYSGYESITDLFKRYKSPYIYNYGLSFWLYINTFHIKQVAKDKQYNMQQIMSFGERFNIMYNNVENELIMLIQDKEIYRTKEIAYQKWNHVVINSHDSKIDLFINNNLLGTYDYEIASFANYSDSIIVGSIDNNNIGSICNFRYYNSLDLGKIKSIYTKYNKKNPPL